MAKKVTIVSLAEDDTKSDDENQTSREEWKSPKRTKRMRRSPPENVSYKWSTTECTVQNIEEEAEDEYFLNQAVDAPPAFKISKHLPPS